jgi:hypothetical protein
MPLADLWAMDNALYRIKIHMAFASQNDSNQTNYGNKQLSRQQGRWGLSTEGKQFLIIHTMLVLIAFQLSQSTQSLLSD